MDASLMDFLNQYLVAQMGIVVVVLWVVGALLKRTPKVPDWAIVWLLLVLGVIGGLFIVGFTVQGVLQGVLAAAVAVFGHQMYKQTVKKNDVDPDKPLIMQNKKRIK